MEDIDILKHAQNYIEKMANGINPLTNELIPDDELLSNVKISRCLFYVNDKLKLIIQNGGNVSKARPQKIDFVYIQENIDKFEYSDEPITLSEIARRLEDAYGNQYRFKRTLFSDLLLKKGVLILRGEEDKKTKANPEMESSGVFSKVFTSPRGSYLGTVYNKDGQKLVLDILKEEYCKE